MMRLFWRGCLDIVGEPSLGWLVNICPTQEQFGSTYQAFKDTCAFCRNTRGNVPQLVLQLVEL